MFSDVLSQTELAILPQIALVIFTGVFVGALAWIFRPGARDTYRRRSHMALDDEHPIDPKEPSHVPGH